MQRFNEQVRKLNSRLFSASNRKIGDASPNLQYRETNFPDRASHLPDRGTMSFRLLANQTQQGIESCGV